VGQSFILRKLCITNKTNKGCDFTLEFKMESQGILSPIFSLRFASLIRTIGADITDTLFVVSLVFFVSELLATFFTIKCQVVKLVFQVSAKVSSSIKSFYCPALGTLEVLYLSNTSQTVYVTTLFTITRINDDIHTDRTSEFFTRLYRHLRINLRHLK
jgi:hypothetical protein